MEIYMDNDVICGELKLNETFIRELIRITLEEINSSNYNKTLNNIDGESFDIYESKYTLDTENKQLDFHSEIIHYVEDCIKYNNLNIDIGDKNMCFKEFIIKIVDKLVQLTNFLRDDIEKNNKNHETEISSRDSEIESIKKGLNDKENKLNEALEETKKLKRAVSILFEENEALKNELNSTCKEVKQIFNTIRKIDSKYIDELKPYIRLNKLEPFIVSSAINIDALDKIWRVAKLAAKNNEPETSEIIRKYFEYMVKLFNEAKNEKVVIIDDINEGEFYNIHDFECIDPNKSYGGIVSKVYLPGFINNYNQKRIEKSLVDIKEK